MAQTPAKAVDTSTVHSAHQIAAEDKPLIPRRLLQVCRNVPPVPLSGSIPRRSISNSRQHQRLPAEGQLFFPVIRFVVHRLEVGSARSSLRAWGAADCVPRAGPVGVVLTRAVAAAAQSC